MHDERLVKLFERYRSAGDLVALGRVFDTVGPRLLRIARHVAARPDDAEDLVQATCLAAIEGAARFDAQRPLEPWLIGILVNQARIARRRRRALDLDASAPSDPAAGPGEALETEELVAAVRTALEHLPERYREVLEPHLREGLRPLEIAARLHRPQGTVRAQLHRGLRLIRTMLPAGFALGVGTLLAPRGWAGVRRRVMAEAERRAAGHDGAARASRQAGEASTASTGGAFAWVLGVAAVAGLCGTLVLFARAAPRDDVVLDGRARPGEQPPRTAELVLDGRDAVAGRVALAGAAPAAAQVERGRSDERAVARSGDLIVSVVDEGGAPLAGERVTVTPWGGARWFAAVQSVLSAADGSARFDDVPVGRVGVHVDGSNAQARAEIAPGETVTLEVRGPRAVRIAGRVLDEHGRGVGGAALCMARAAGDELVSGAGFAVVAHSADDGAFELAAPLGAWVMARVDGRAPSAAAWIDGLRAHDVHALELVLGPGGEPLTGTVVDAAGAPLARARLAVFAADASSAAGVARAPRPRIAHDGSLAVDAPLVVEVRDGSFALGAVPAGPLRLVCDAPGHQPLERVVRLPGEGAGPVVFALEPAARIVGNVFDPAGVPCRGALVEVVCGPDAPRSARTDEAGAFAIDGLPTARVSISAALPGLRPARTRLTVNAGSEASWVARLADGETIEGRVQGPQGPVVKWLVRAVREQDAAGAAAAEGLPAWMAALLCEPKEALVQAYTDEDGRFVLPSEPGASYVLELRQRGAWRGPPQLRQAGVRSERDDVRLVLGTEAGAIRIDLGGRAADAGLFVAVPEEGGSPVRSRANGAGIDPLPPGRYALHRWPCGGAPVDYGTFELGAGEVLELDLDELERRARR